MGLGTKENKRNSHKQEGYEGMRKQEEGNLEAESPVGFCGRGVTLGVTFIRAGDGCVWV